MLVSAAYDPADYLLGVGGRTEGFTSTPHLGPRNSKRSAMTIISKRAALQADKLMGLSATLEFRQPLGSVAVARTPNTCINGESFFGMRLREISGVSYSLDPNGGERCRP